jgi:hypothetical protein
VNRTHATLLVEEVGDVVEGQFSNTSDDSIGRDAGALRSLGHRFGDRVDDVRFSKVLVADLASGLRTVPGADRGLGGVEIDEVLFDEAALPSR